MRFSIVVLSLLAVAVLLSGCSLAFTSGPDHPSDPRVFPDCTDSMVFPTLDGLTAVSILLTPTHGGSSDGADVAALAAFTAFTAGSLIGYRRVEKCKAARNWYIANQPMATPPQPPPWTVPPSYPPVLSPPHGPVP